MAKPDDNAPKPMIEGHKVEKFDKSSQFHRQLIGRGMKAAEEHEKRGDVPIYPGGYLSYDPKKWSDIAPKEKKAAVKKTAAAPKKSAAAKPAAKTTKKAAATKTSTKKTK